MSDPPPPSPRGARERGLLSSQTKSAHRFRSKVETTASTLLTQAALERLYVELEKPIYNVVYRWVWNADDAHDIVQDAFVRLWKMRDRVRLETVQPLVYKIALNLASKRRRSKKLWQWMSLDTLLGRASGEVSPERRAEGQQSAANLRSAVESLPNHLKQTLLLCEFSEMTYDQVAEALSIPAGTVGSRRHKAVRLIREKLEALEVPS